MKIKKWTILLILALVFVVSTGCILTNLMRSAVSQVQELQQNQETQAPENLPLVQEATEPPATIEEPTNIPTELPTAEPGTIIVPEYANLTDTLEALYQQVSPGVVSIQFSTTQGQGLGSGFVIDKEGHIVTNYHVVENVDEPEIHFPSGLKVYGEVIGTDLDSDLAVIKVDVDPDDLYPVKLGDSDTALVGQTVVAIGNPYGLSGTMTMGIISARGRVLDSIRQTNSGTFFSAGDLIQTDTSINPGNSGGPLLNLKGEVVGVNRAIQTSGISALGDPGYTGIGFAVSSNIVRRVVPSLIANGSYDYPYLGMTSLNSLSLAVQEVLDLPQSTGAYITDITTGGPADKAGLRAGTQQSEITGLYRGGDLIIAVDGIPIKDFSELLSYMVLNKTPGEVITFTIMRDGEQMDVPVTLGKRP